MNDFQMDIEKQTPDIIHSKCSSKGEASSVEIGGVPTRSTTCERWSYEALQRLSFGFYDENLCTEISRRVKPNVTRDIDQLVPCQDKPII